MLMVSILMLSDSTLKIFLRKLEAGLSGTGICALPRREVNVSKNARNILYNCFNSSEFS